MANVLEFLEKQFPDAELLKAVRQAAASLDTDTYLVGGFVRDMLMGRDCKDVDFMCVGDGIALAMEVHRLLGKEGQPAVHKNFGTASFVHNGLWVEFVGARKESYRSHSRNPEVSPGTLEDDLARRDFTINALAIRLTGEDPGELIDLFGGFGHLQEGLLKTPLDPDRTFDDDPLRMLRGIRFAAQLNFRLDGAALESMKRHRERLRIVAAERIGEELNKMLLSPHPAKAFKLLFNTGILEVIFPEMARLQGVEYQDGHGHKDNFYHTLEVLTRLRAKTDKLWLLWSAVLHDIAKPRTKRFEPGHGWTFHGHEELGARMVPGIFKRLGLPQNEKCQYVQKLVRLHLRPIVLSKEDITDSAIRRLIFEAGDDLEDLMLLCEADITSKNDAKVKRYLANYELVRRKIAEVEARDHIRNFQPPVSGEEVMRLFNLPPCKTVGILKNAVKEAILDGVIPNERTAALNFLMEEARKLGLEPVNSP